MSSGADRGGSALFRGIHHVFDLISTIEGLIFRIRLLNLRATHNTISNLPEYLRGTDYGALFDMLYVRLSK